MIKILLLCATTLALSGCYLAGSSSAQLTPEGAALLGLIEGTGTIAYSQRSALNCFNKDHRLMCADGLLMITDKTGAQISIFEVNSVCTPSDEMVRGDYYLPGKLLTCAGQGLYKNKIVKFTSRFAQHEVPLVSMVDGQIFDENGVALVSHPSK